LESGFYTTRAIIKFRHDTHLQYTDFQLVGLRYPSRVLADGVQAGRKRNLLELPLSP